MFELRVFVSYSRRDSAEVEALVAHLVASGCLVWIDRKDILAGDDFVHSLTSEVGRSDALVVLLTSRSAASSWCQAEIQRALARGINVILVQRDPAAQLPDAMERLLRDIQRVTWTACAPDLGSQLQKARRRKRLQQIRTVGATVSIVALLCGVGLLTASRINELGAEKRVERALSAVAASTSVWSGAEIRSRIQPVRHESTLASGLHVIFNDATRSAVARTNAWQGLDSLHEGREREWRTFLPQVMWKGARLADWTWANTTYGEGSIKDLVAQRMRVAGVVFGAGPSESKTGLTLSGIRVSDSDLWFLRIDGTQLVDVEFVNSKFRGAQLDLTGATGLRFTSNSASEIFMGPDVTIVEDSWIAQHGEVESPPGVIDLSTPAQEILFDGVVFSRVRFEGNFKPQWFRNSHFIDCVFPPHFPVEAVMKNGSHNENGLIAER